MEPHNLLKYNWRLVVFWKLKTDNLRVFEVKMNLTERIYEYGKTFLTIFAKKMWNSFTININDRIESH